MKSTNWTRRQVLKGAGVALSVPWLETLAPKKAHAAGATKRYMSVYWPNGTASGYWSPTGSGTNLTLSPIQQPLEPNKAKALILGHVGNYLPWNGHIEPSHGHNSATAWTGVRASTLAGVNKDHGDDYVRSSISVDQTIANLLVTQNNNTLPTPLHSLQLGLSTMDSYTDGLPGPHSRSISWKSAAEPLYKVISPAAVFQRLMAGGFPAGGSNMTPPTTDAAAMRRIALKKSALDYILDSSTSLKLRLSRTDGVRLDAFLNSVKSLEARVANMTLPGMPSSTVQGCSVPTNPPTQSYVVGANGGAGVYNRGTHATLMIDLAVLAFQCDMTRVVSFMLDDARSDFGYDFLGKERQFTATGSQPGTATGVPVVAQYHGLQHTNETNNGFATISWWNMDRLNELVTKISNIKEGAGTAMDGTVIHAMSGMHGGNHDSLNLPIVIMGSGGGVLKQGQYVDFPATAGPNMSGRNLQDVHLTIINKVFGGSLPMFGTPQGAYMGTTGVINELLA